MRKSVLVALTPLLLLGAAGCFAAPEPPRGSPAPTLPPDSIAYDHLPVVTDRPVDYMQNCDRITASGDLGPRMGFAQPPTNSQLGPGCQGQTTDGGTLLIEPLRPNHLVPDPWDSAWNTVVVNPEHFRRMIFLDRYYATTAVAYRLGGSGCTATVNVGGKFPLTVTRLLNEEESSQYRNWEQPDVTELSDKACPMALKATTELLNTIDPGGGSRGAA